MPRMIIKSSNHGFPVNSTNASNVIEFLAALEAINLDKLPFYKISHKLGWQDYETNGFLWGKNHIILNETKDAPLSDDGHPDQLVTFKRDSTVEEVCADGFRKQGKVETWMEAIKVASKYPRAMIGLYTSFLPVILEIINCPNFVLDYSSKTSGGKTTALRIAASTAGNPNEKASDSIVYSWSSTKVWIERYAGLVGNLPIILDETQLAESDKDVASVLYLIANGKGKGRGSTFGSDSVLSWRTVLISSGEKPAVSFTRDGGTKARVITITGSPFNHRNLETKKDIDFINHIVCSHYGHAYPLFVEYVMRNKESWDNWQEQYRKKVYELVSAEDDAIIGRLADYVAAIQFAAELVH